MKILVTGHNGNIGGEFFNLLKNKHIVCGYDLPGRDILDYKKLDKYIESCDIVVHFAAIANLNDTAKDIDKNFDVNVKGTYNIAKLCSEHNKKLVFISTCCVYGDTEGKQREEKTIPQTIEPYACSKMAGEYLIRGFNLDYVIVRIGTVYGHGTRKELFTNIVIDSAFSGKPFELHGSGEQTRQYIHIKDLIRGINIIMNRFDDVNKETINLCGDEHISCLDVIDEVNKYYHVVHKVVEHRKQDFMKENISIKKMKKLGYKQEISFKQGIADTIKKRMLQQYSQIIERWIDRVR